jgi:type I restriction enzyme S subunit
VTWPIVALGEVFDIARGGSPRPIDDYITEDAAGMNWVMISDASASGKVIYQTKKRIRLEGLKKTRQVFPGDFILSNSMSFGRPYIMGTDGCIHDGWLLMRPKTEQLDADYFYYLLGSPDVYQSFASRAAGATVKNLNSDIVRQVSVPLPPLEEQKRIAAILDQADALRRLRARALDRLNSLGQAIFHEMFGGPEVPVGDWGYAPLESFVHHEDRINYGVVQPGDHDPNGVPIIRVADLTSPIIDLDQVKRISPEIDREYSRSRLKGGEILIGCVGSIGTTLIAPQAYAGANIARAVARVPVDPALCNPIFLNSYLRTAAVQNFFTKEVRLVAQPTLNIKQIRETKILLAPRELQDEFAERLQAAQLAQDAMAQAASASRTLFTSLQHSAFRGEL